MSEGAVALEPEVAQPRTGTRVAARTVHQREAPPSQPPSPAGERVAPLHGWRRVARDGLYVGGSTTVGHLLAAATSLLLRVLLDPAEMGIWQGLKVVLSYANYTNLGTSKAAARELAIARGRGDVSTAQNSLNLAFTFNTLTSGIYALVVLGAAGWIALASGGAWRWSWVGGLAAVALLAMLQRHVTFLVTLLRSLQRFAITSQVAVLEAVLTLAVAVSAAWVIGLPGLYLGTLVVFLGSWWWLQSERKIVLHWSFRGQEIRQLIAIGAPLLLVGLLTSVFRSLDKLLILSFLDDREFQLGCYSLAVLATTQLTGVANMLSIVMGPRFAEMLGHAGDHRHAARLAARTMELQALLMTAAGGLMIVLVPAVLARLLPDYVEGLTPLVYRTPGLIAFGLTLPLGSYLLAVNQQGRALLALALAFVTASMAGAVAVRSGTGLAGIALAMTAADIVQLVALVALSFAGALDRRGWLRLTGITGLLVLPALAFALALESHFPGPNAAWTTTLAKCGGLLTIVAVSALVVYRLGGWSHDWRQELAEC